MNNTWKSMAIGGSLLVLLTVIVYLPALHGGFVWDDDSWTTNISGLLRDFSGLQTIWRDPTALQQYYPLSGTTFWIDYHLWGFWTLPYHVENVLLHALAALLFWQLLRRLEVPGAGLAAAIFAFHPVMVESAAWITERKNVLSLALYVGALLAYGRFNSFWKEGSEITPRWRAYVCALLLTLGALLAKTTAFSLPAVILLIGWWKRGRIRWRTDVLPALPFFAAAIGFSLATAWLEKNHVGAHGPEWALSFAQRCLIAGRALWFYVGKLFWPANLCFIYPRWQPDPSSWRQWLYPISAIGALLALWLTRGQIGRGPAAAAFFFVGTLFPVLGFMNAYGMRYSFVWDHWVYLSSLGLIALAAALVARVTERLRTQKLLHGFTAVISPVLMILTWQQCRMYSNLETLWRTTIAQNPNAFLAYNNLGSALSAEGRTDEAVALLQKILKIQPDLAEAHNNLGNALVKKGQLDEAIASFQRAVQIQPDNPKAHNNLGNALLQKGLNDEAIDHFKKALEIDPDLVDARNRLGVALMRTGHLDEAIPQCQRAIELKPDYAEAHYNLGVALGLQGRLDEAAEQYRKAIEIKPDNFDAHGNLANVLFAQGHYEEAVEQYHQTLVLVPNSAQAHYKLGLALQAQNKLGLAIEHYQEALRLDPTHAGARQQLLTLDAAPHE